MAREHGLSSYTIGCRCSDCVTTGRAYNNERRRRIAYGRPTTDLIDAEPAREHVVRLLSLGWSRRQITSITGGDIAALLYGRPSEGLPPLRRISVQASRKILQIPLELVATDKRIPADGSRRRSQALCALGHSVSWQAAESGVARSVLSPLVNGDFRMVQARHAVAVRDLYAKWWDRPAAASRGASRVRGLALRKGYLPPLAWDDDLIDLPDEELEAELARRVSLMDDEELRRCSTAYKAEGEKSPEVVAAAREWRRRLGSQRLAA